MYPNTSSMVKIISSFRSLEISEGILRIQENDCFNIFAQNIDRGYTLEQPK